MLIYAESFQIFMTCTSFWFLATFGSSEWLFRVLRHEGAGWQDFIQSLYDEARDVYWVAGAGPPGCEWHENSTATPVTAGIATVVHLFVWFESNALLLCTMPIQIFIGLLLNNLMKDFKELYTHQSDCNFQLVLRRYDSIKSVVKQTNYIFGPLYVCAMLMILMYFPGFTGMLGFFSWRTNTLKLILFVVGTSGFMMSAAAIFYFGAKLNGRALKFYEWAARELRQDQKSNSGVHPIAVASLNLAALQVDMSMSQLSMKGADFFVFTTNLATTVSKIVHDSGSSFFRISGARECSFHFFAIAGSRPSVNVHDSSLATSGVWCQPLVCFWG